MMRAHFEIAEFPGAACRGAAKPDVVFMAGDLRKVWLVVRPEQGRSFLPSRHEGRDGRETINMRHGGAAMFEILDRRTSLTGNQIKSSAQRLSATPLEFFDYFLIGFVLAFLIGPCGKRTFGQSAIVLMSSGIGAIIGAYVWGWLAIASAGGRVVHRHVLNSLSPPACSTSHPTMAGFISPSCASSSAPGRRPLLRGPAAGAGIHALLQARLDRRPRHLRHPAWRRPRRGARRFMGSDQWRLLFAIGVLPSLMVLLVRIWVPESPRWLCGRGATRMRASRSLGIQVEPSTLPLPTAADAGPSSRRAGSTCSSIRAADRLLVGNAGAQTGVYGRHAVGAIAVRAAPEGSRRRKRQDDDRAQRLRLHRPGVVSYFSSCSDAAAPAACSAWARVS